MTDVKHHIAGLIRERMPSGAYRYRVRVEGDKTRRVAIPCGPDDPSFWEHYYAARRGQTYHAPPTAEPMTLQWLVDRYLSHFAKEVEAGLKSAMTLKQRRSLLTRLCAFEDKDGQPYSELHVDMPPEAFVKVRDAMTATPAEADNMMKAARSMYAFLVERKELAVNPLVGIGTIHESRGGAKPWKATDLKQFREAHPKGTTAHLWLTLVMFTGCRIGDAIWLGRECEYQHQGATWLHWQPRKRGSAPVDIPMVPPLYEATRAAKVQGAAYLLSEYGRPFKNPESLRMRVRRWCDAAGLTDRSSHGVRKGLAELLAEQGANQHAIMAIMAHTKASTSEIYTKDAQRKIMAGNAMQILRGMDW